MSLAIPFLPASEMQVTWFYCLWHAHKSIKPSRYKFSILWSVFSTCSITTFILFFVQCIESICMCHTFPLSTLIGSSNGLRVVIFHKKLLSYSYYTINNFRLTQRNASLFHVWNNFNAFQFNNIYSHSLLNMVLFFVVTYAFDHCWFGENVATHLNDNKVIVEISNFGNNNIISY